MQKSNTTCLFFLQGRCKYGDNCRFLHDPSLIPQLPSKTDEEYVGRDGDVRGYGKCFKKFKLNDAPELDGFFIGLYSPIMGFNKYFTLKRSYHIPVPPNTKKTGESEYHFIDSTFYKVVHKYKYDIKGNCFVYYDSVVKKLYGLGKKVEKEASEKKSGNPHPQVSNLYKAEE
jgi:hypothetical protein